MAPGDKIILGPQFSPMQITEEREADEDFDLTHWLRHFPNIPLYPNVDYMGATGAGDPFYSW